MGKRKRLTPAKTATPETVSTGAEAAVETGQVAAPETKSAFPRFRDGFVGNGPLPPSTSASTAAATSGTAPRSHAPIAAVAEATAATAALSELSDQMRDARENGRMIQALPLDQIDADYLVRDRVGVDDGELQALCDSIAQRGQQTPIEVVRLDNGRFGLISGWRRLTALRKLHAEGGDTQDVLAILRKPETASDAYLAMIEENEIRVGLSFYERARIVLRAVDMGVYPSEKAALQDLFRSASRAKRSKVKSFIPIVQQLDDVLNFPAALSERLGLQLSQALQQNDDLAANVKASLAQKKPASSTDEQAELSHLLTGKDTAPVRSPKPNPAEIAPGYYLKKSSTGALTLSGAKVDADFETQLVNWLKSQKP